MINGTLGIIPVKDIDFGERGRIDYKDIPSLATSIKERGLIHPIAVCPHPIGSGFLLLAGGRRLRAHQFAQIENVECKIFPPGLEELEIKLIELAENIYREDLEYHEKCKMERDIRDLMYKIYGRKTSTAEDAVGVSDRDVAKMIGVSHAKLSQDISLVKTMETFPEVDWSKFKNQAEAIKVKENISKTIVRHEAVKNFEKAVGRDENHIKSRLANAYIVGDFFEKVKEIPDNSINLVEIDPPYAIDLQANKKRSTASSYSYGENGYNEIAVADYVDFIYKTFQESYRVMASGSFIVCWYAIGFWQQLITEALYATGFNYRTIPCLWIKGEADEGETLVERSSGQTNRPISYLANAYESFIYGWKGDAKLAKPGRTNVFGFKPVSPKKKIHPTERPLELMNEVLTTFVLEGSRVLVPFAGSGVTLISAFQNKMMPIGFDLGQLHKDAFIARLEEIF